MGEQVKKLLQDMKNFNHDLIVSTMQMRITREFDELNKKINENGKVKL